MFRDIQLLLRRGQIEISQDSMKPSNKESFIDKPTIDRLIIDQPAKDKPVKDRPVKNGSSI